MMDKLNSTTAAANAPAPRSESRRKSSDDFSKELSANAQAVAAPAPALDASSKLSLSGAVERSPQTRTGAASMNAAAAITGLKPWSREWVFEGKDAISQARGQNVKPLFGESFEDEAKAAASGEAGKGVPENLGKPGEGAAEAGAAAALAGAPGALALASGSRGNAGADKAGAKGPESAAAPGAGQQKAGQAPGRAGANAPLANPALASASTLQQQHFTSSSPVGSAGAAGENAALLAGVAALNGEILSDSGDANPVSAAAQPTQLSGAEFMSALGAARLGARGGSEQDSSNLSGESGQHGGGQFGQNRTLRALDGGKRVTGLPGREDMLVLGGAEPLRGNNTQTLILPTNVEGRVTQGSMTRNRLTSESLLNMTNGIRDFAGSGGGEMRVRLKPDNLGELNVRVLTRGNDVRLQIQATDEKARKILEESMPHLKEKLASQNLNLGRVEVSLAPHNPSARAEQDTSQQQQQFQQHSMNDWMGQNQERGQNTGNRWADVEAAYDEPRSVRASARPGISALAGGTASSAARGNELEPGRLDVRA